MTRDFSTLNGLLDDLQAARVKQKQFRPQDYAFILASTDVDTVASLIRKHAEELISAR